MTTTKMTFLLKCVPIVCVFLCVFFSGKSFAEIRDDIKSYLDRSDAQLLHDHPRWHRLIHYEQSMIGAGVKSNISEPSFFLSEYGANSPKKELHKTISYLFTSSEGDDHPWCRFPARSRFITHHLSIPREMFAHMVCPAFDVWWQQLDVDSVWLIFPAAYLNSPSSMFGHTLLRLDPPQSNHSSKLLAQAVNYAANVDEKDSEVTFAYKGLFGGYPGYFTMVPYHKKVKEYGKIENRDIWEYKLNLTADEIDWLTRHLWELNEVKFDYFFSSKNCSYQLLALLDVARMGEALTKGFSAQTIPVDTVRRLQSENWIQERFFRPSQSKQFYRLTKELSKREAELVKGLQKTPISEHENTLSKLTVARQQVVVETAYKLARLHNKRVSTKRALGLLRYRSKLGGKQFVEPVVESSAPETSHYSNRVFVGAGFRERDQVMEEGAVFSFRPAFHSLDDRLQGFSSGAQINFLQAEFFATENDLELTRFDVVDIRSLSLSNYYMKSLAWQVNGGVQQKLDRFGRNTLMGQFAVELGRTYELGFLRIYTLMGLHTEYDHSNVAEVSFGPSFEQGVFIQTSGFTTELRFQYDYSIEQEQERKHLMWKSQIPLSQNLSVGMDVNREEFERFYQNSASLRVQLYY